MQRDAAARTTPTRAAGRTCNGRATDAGADACASVPVSLPAPRRTPAPVGVGAKKKTGGKGLFKLKPKSGCRTLAQQLKDYTTIVIILLLTALLGRYMHARKVAAAEVHGGGDAHAAAKAA
eukprot:6313419-Prymnesium_polylepis.2